MTVTTYDAESELVLAPVADRMRDRARLDELVASGEAARLRRRAGLGSPVVARILKTTHASVLRWEQGNRKPDDDNLPRYLAFLDRLAAMERQADAESAA